MADLRIAGITKSFGVYQALQGIDLQVAEQEFLVLLGASGCGKSTLLRVIAGLETADRGSVHVGDRRIDTLAPRDRHLSMVFQNYAVFPHLTVFENIAFGLRMQRKDDPFVQRKVREVAELVHLEALLQRYSGQLSGGQRQRVALARALAVEPAVILMDEPLSNLDALLRLEMRAELKTILAQSRATTVYVTHDQVEAMSMADRIAVMNAGVIEQCDTPLKIYRNPATTFVAGFMGTPPMNFLPAREVAPGQYQVRGYTCAGPQGHGQLTLGIRPEDLRPAETGLVVRAQVIEPLGAQTLVTQLAEGQVIRVALPSDFPVTQGQALVLQPDPRRLRWYDAAGKRVSAPSQG
jgi:multiple sugar transport system ATP-binding protein